MTDIEKELERFIASGKATTKVNSGRFQTTHIDPLKIAKHFAQWQKEQMLKDAVELGVWNYSNDTDMRALPIWGKEEFSHLKEDDMVKVIIIKE